MKSNHLGGTEGGEVAIPPPTPTALDSLSNAPSSEKKAKKIAVVHEPIRGDFDTVEAYICAKKAYELSKGWSRKV